MRHLVRFYFSNPFPSMLFLDWFAIIEKCDRAACPDKVNVLTSWVGFLLNLYCFWPSWPLTSQEKNLEWFPRMRAMSLVSSEGDGEQNEMRCLQEKLNDTVTLVAQLSGQLSELKEQVEYSSRSFGKLDINANMIRNRTKNEMLETSGRADVFFCFSYLCQYTGSVDCRLMMLLNAAWGGVYRATEICQWASCCCVSSPADWVWPITLITCLPCMWFQSQACPCSSSARCVKTAPTVWGSHTSKQDNKFCRHQSLTRPYWPRGPSWKPPN